MKSFIVETKKKYRIDLQFIFVITKTDYSSQWINYTVNATTRKNTKTVDAPPTRTVTILNGRIAECLSD